MSGYEPWLAIAVGGGVGLVMSHLLKRRREGPRCGATRRNPKGGVDARRIAMLAVGAPLSAHWRAYADSLATGHDVNGLRQALRDGWGIEDGASFRRMIPGLLAGGGDHQEFDRVCRIYATHERARWEEAAAAHDLDAPELLDQLERLDALLPSLVKAGIGDVRDVERTVLAWDLVRVVANARASHDAGYLEADEAWRLIEQAYEQARRAYKSWRELATSYVIARALWGGDGEPLDHFIEVTARMLNDPHSPYRTSALA